MQYRGLPVPHATPRESLPSTELLTEVAALSQQQLLQAEDQRRKERREEGHLQREAAAWEEHLEREAAAWEEREAAAREDRPEVERREDRRRA